MAVKYRIEYKDIEDVDTRIDIESSSYSGAVIELEPDDDPLVIDMPAASELFNPAVQGSGGVIRVLASDSDNLRSLYTSDPKEYPVKIYKAGTTTAHIIFFGYVSAGYYTEPFNEYDNYPVSITFNDGFNLLGRYDYLNAGSKYSGNEPILDVVLRAVNQIGLPYHKISIATDMYYWGYTIASNDTILQHLKVNNANYYDENNTPMKFKEVLEGILQPLGLICFTHAGTLVILDPLLLYSASFTLKNFNTSTGAYINSTTITPNKELDTDFEWYETGAMLDFLNGYSKILMDYSGYAADNMIVDSNWSDKSRHPSAGSWSAKGVDPDDGDDYEINTTWGGIEGYTVYNGAIWQGTRYDGVEEFHAEWERYDPESEGSGLMKLKFNGASEYVHGMEGQFLKIRYKCYVETGDSYYNAEGILTRNSFYGLQQWLRIKVGNHYYQGGTPTWTTTPTDSFHNSKQIGECNDMWFEFEASIPLWQAFGPAAVIAGGIEIIWYDKGGGLGAKWSIFTGYIDLKFYRIKDVEVFVVDSSGNELNHDLQYECDLNTLWQSTAPKLDLIHGDSSEGVASHRGGFVDDNDSFATNFRYGNMTTFNQLPEVLFKKLASQYEHSRMKLSCKLTSTQIYSAGLSKLCNISESVNLPGKKFILLRGSYHDRDKMITGDWLEIKEDTITIV